ncbi:unnamed protein product, partial [Heterosigma akashiwo]
VCTLYDGAYADWSCTDGCIWAPNATEYADERQRSSYVCCYRSTSNNELLK